MKSLIFTIIAVLSLSLSLSSISFAHNGSEDYFKFIDDKLNQYDVYIVPKLTIISRSKKLLKKTLNYVASNNGNYNKYDINKLGSRCYKGWSLAKILESDGDLLKIQYQIPYTDKKVTTGWVHLSQLINLGNYRDNKLN